MSTRGKNYNPRHSLPVKKNEKIDQIEDIELKEEDVNTNEHISNEIGDNVDGEYQEEHKEEDMEELIKEIHQEVITNGFEEEKILQTEQEVKDKIQEILGNTAINNSDSFSSKDHSREEIPEIVVSKGIRTREVYEKEFDNFTKAISGVLKNSNQQQTDEVVYKFKMNDQTGKVEMLSPADNIERAGIVVDINQQEVVGNMLRTSVAEATKLEIEIFVHEEIIKDEFDPTKIQNLQRKIDTLKSNLEFINKKNAILLKLIK